MWLVELAGDPVDLRRLVEVFREDTLRILEEQNERFLLASSDFEHADDTHAVRNRAAKLVNVANGVATLHFPRFRPVRLGNTIYERDGGRQSVTITPEPVELRIAGASLSMLIKRNEGSVASVANDSGRLTRWMKLTDDQVAAKVLRLLANEDNWAGLYKIYEIVAAEAGESLWESVSKRQIELFRRTACSPASVGDSARHGVQSSAPPPNPMDLRVARELIRKIAREWLRAKLECT